MKELRLTIIEEAKRVDVSIIDADSVLDKIKNTPGHKFAPGAGQLQDLIATVLSNCGDTDKVEIGPDGAFHNVADGGKVPVAL
jgi:hypothetical protein